MYDPRYSPNFQIPFQPLFEATRQEIERTIFTLEEKFRRRRQIDLELALPHPIQYQQTHLDRLRSIQEEERLLRLEQESYFQRQLAAEAQSDYLKRIEALRIERGLLQRGNQIRRDLQYPTFGGPFVDSNQDDDELIKKYQNGSKAKEYYHDLALQNQRNNQEDASEREIHRRQKEEKEQRQRLQKKLAQERANKEAEQYPNIKINGTSSDRVDINRNRDVFGTPYDILNLQQTSNKKEDFKRSPLAQELEKEFDRIQEEKEQLNTKLAKTMKDKAFSPLAHSNKASQKTASPLKAINKYQSMGKFAPKRPNSSLSPHKKSYQDSYLQSRRARQTQPQQPKPSMKEIQVNALKKIQNRLRVSKVIYEDSQFRNTKYEGNHLYNTFEIESRQRKEIKEKVNNNPMVLKKHPLVVD